MKERLRAFVAVELSPETRSSLAAEVLSLRALGADVKWVAEENLHITVKFLGQVNRHQVPGVLDALGRAVKDARSFNMEMRGLAFFPSPVRPRVVAAGVAEEALPARASRAARHVDQKLPPRFKKEERGFKAHATLGRVKSPKGIRALSDYLLTWDGRAFGEDNVESVTLFMSELTRAGAVYTALGHARLGGTK